MNIYRIYVHKDHNILSEAELIKHYKEDRTKNYWISDEFVSEYQIRTGDLVSPPDSTSEKIYRVKVVIVQTSQIALITEELK